MVHELVRYMKSNYSNFINLPFIIWKQISSFHITIYNFDE